MKISLLTILLFTTINMSAQINIDTDGLNNSSNIYLYALTEYCKTLDSSKMQTVNVRKDSFIGNNWPSKIGVFQILYLDNYKQYKAVIKANAGNTIVVGIGELNFKDGKFYVGVIPFITTIKRKKIRFLKSTGLQVLFNYDCSENKFTFGSSKWLGI